MGALHVALFTEFHIEFSLCRQLNQPTREDSMRVYTPNIT